MSVTPDQRFLRFREAYLLMAKEARYRPKAPSDGFGHIVLSLAEQLDQKRLEDEAGAYAAESARLCEQYARTRARRATEIPTDSAPLTNPGGSTIPADKRPPPVP